MNDKNYQKWQKKFLNNVKDYVESGNEQIANQRGNITAVDSEAISSNVVEKLDCSNSDLVVEIGCGTGLLAKVISPLIYYYIGFDISMDLLQIARNKNGLDNSYFLQGDGQLLPIRSCIANKVLLNSVVPYFPPKVLRKVLREIKRILKPEGILMIGDIPNPSWARNYLNKRYGISKKAGFEQIRLIAFKTKIKIKEILGPAGIKMINKCFIWYEPRKILEILREEGFQGEISKEHRDCPFQHFRYDCLAKKIS